MVSISAGFVAFVVGTILTLAVPVLSIWLLYKVFQVVFFVLGGAARLVGHTGGRIGRFVQGEVVDTLHLAGGVVTAGVILPLSLANVLIGRFAAARHYGRALEDELMSALVSLYRIALGHPTRFLGLGALTQGLERRIPDLVARAPRTGSVPARRPAKARFAGYTIERELQAGGSGARLFLARPDEAKLRELGQRGTAPLGQVVIKCFDRSFGSTLPQIVRESRALEAAKRLGHVIEHELDDEHFHYVMPYVPGEDLDVVTRRMHARSGERGLDRRALAKVLGYASDLCETLERFHGEGLWHKDIKPTNLLVSADRLQVVDLGLVTPLASALTLTTHGTEYFRDPELVRLAMRGVKVHEVDGVKFDLYSAGAVLFSMLENSFPAHGSLSRLTKPVPEALAWIVRRAMSDVSQRYPSASAMRRDLAVVLAASDPFAVRPADLPSFSRADEPPARAGLAANLGGLTLPPPASEPAPAKRKAAAASAVPPSADTARRQVRRRTLGSYVLVAMFLCIVGGAVTFSARGGAFGRQGQAAFSELGQLFDGHVVHGGRREPATPVTPYEARAQRREFGTATAQATRPAPSLRALEADAPSLGRVLVVVDPAVAGPESWRPFADHVRGSGFTPVGLGEGRADIEWLAGAGRALEGAPLGDASAVTRVERWLAQQGGDLVAVLWLGPGSRPGAIAAQLIAGPTHGRDTLSALRAPEGALSVKVHATCADTIGAATH